MLADEREPALRAEEMRCEPATVEEEHDLLFPAERLVEELLQASRKDVTSLADGPLFYHVDDLDGGERPGQHPLGEDEEAKFSLPCPVEGFEGGCGRAEDDRKSPKPGAV